MDELMARVRGIMSHRRWPGACLGRCEIHHERFADTGLELEALEYALRVKRGDIFLSEVRRSEDVRAVQQAAAHP